MITDMADNRPIYGQQREPTDSTINDNNQQSTAQLQLLTFFSSAQTKSNLQQQQQRKMAEFLLNLLSNFSGIPPSVLAHNAAGKRRTQSLTNEERFSIVQMYKLMLKGRYQEDSEKRFATTMVSRLGL